MSTDNKDIIDGLVLINMEVVKALKAVSKHTVDLAKATRTTIIEWEDGDSVEIGPVDEDDVTDVIDASKRPKKPKV